MSDVTITYMVINSLLGGLTLDPAGMHCPWWDDAFVSSYFLFSDCVRVATIWWWI